jgi:prepilin-type N-terminal cleavage/methylation domain-containing protein
MTGTDRPGVTLVELIVALALLGLIAAVASIAIPSQHVHTASDDVTRTITDARQTAVASGHTATVTVTRNGAPHAVTALPDGAIIADSVLGIDPLSGAPVARAASGVSHAP